jgi:UDP-3-O-[3-hydroxymyristoyl] N-acetylglucosamine deacetylase
MQKTLQKEISLTGVGLHSGQEITLTLKPAAINSGITFVRTDLPADENLIPALWDHVVDTKLCTVVANKNGASVGTIEHLMSALCACGIDNIILEINGAEVPIMDGSAAPFSKAIDEAGIALQDAPGRAIRILKEVSVEKDGKRVTLSPAETATYTGQIDFNHPDIGQQDYSVQLLNGNFRHEIADARTFGFLHEVEYLRSIGLARGGSLDNAIVLDTDKVLNEDGLRFENEFIRHKLLDAIGDLYLAGAPIQGEYYGVKAGHEMNNAILHALFADDSAWEYA